MIVKEIIEVMNELGKDLFVFVVIVGIGGMIIGIGEVLRENYLNMIVYVVELVGFFVLSGGRFGKYKFVGISFGFIFDMFNVDVYDEILKIKDE